MHDYLDDNQKKAVEALVELKRICDRHNIEFYLIAGSCLGAVRHKGMIPWDDDVDVGFLYDDWKKLKSVISDELQNGFSYIDNDIDSSYPRLFGKVLYDKKPCVDLFILAKWTNKKWSGLLHWRIRIFAVEGFKFTLKKNKKACRPGDSKMVCIKNKMHFFIQSCIFFVLSPFVSTKWYVDIARKNEVYFEGLENDYCYINLYSVYSRKKEQIKREWVEDNPSLVEFEGEFYNTLSDTDAYLRHLYGDYMTLPPESERKRIHDVVF